MCTTYLEKHRLYLPEVSANRRPGAQLFQRMISDVYKNYNTDQKLEEWCLMLV